MTKAPTNPSNPTNPTNSTKSAPSATSHTSGSDERTNVLRAYFLSLLPAETAANDRALDSLLTVPAWYQTSEAYRRALGLMAHLVLAKRVWLLRLENQPWQVDDWFAPWSVEDSRAQGRVEDERWRTFLERLGPGDLDRTLGYTASDGVRYESRVLDILTHVFNHSTYHRGQVARIVHQCEGRRAGTDFVALTRRKVEG